MLFGPSHPTRRCLAVPVKVLMQPLVAQLSFRREGTDHPCLLLLKTIAARYDVHKKQMPRVDVIAHPNLKDEPLQHQHVVQVASWRKHFIKHHLIIVIKLPYDETRPRVPPRLPANGHILLHSAPPLRRFLVHDAASRQRARGILGQENARSNRAGMCAR